MSLLVQFDQFCLRDELMIVCCQCHADLQDEGHYVAPDFCPHCGSDWIAIAEDPEELASCFRDFNAT